MAHCPPRTRLWSVESLCCTALRQSSGQWGQGSLQHARSAEGCDHCALKAAAAFNWTLWAAISMGQLAGSACAPLQLLSRPAFALHRQASIHRIALQCPGRAILAQPLALVQNLEFGRTCARLSGSMRAWLSCASRPTLSQLLFPPALAERAAAGAQRFSVAATMTLPHQGAGQQRHERQPGQQRQEQRLSTWDGECCCRREQACWLCYCTTIAVCGMQSMAPMDARASKYTMVGQLPLAEGVRAVRTPPCPAPRCRCAAACPQPAQTCAALQSVLDAQAMPARRS